jgi:predicted MFS family arabinose efflux permease
VILGALTLLGVLLAWLLGADLRRLALVRLRASWVVFVALAVQLVLFTPASRVFHLPVSETATHLVTYGALLAFVVANIAQPGFAIAALGCNFNAMVIFVNGGHMPVSLASWTATGRSAEDLTRDGVYNNVVLAHDANLGCAAVVGGVLATPLLDRFARFRTLWFVEVVRGALMLATIPLAATGSYYAVMATVAGSAALSAATDPCAASLVPELLPPRLVHAGNALHGVMRNVMMVAGTLVGGVAVAKLGMSRALLIDVTTFALAAVLYRRFASAGAPEPEEARAASRVAVLAALVRQPVALGLTVSFTVVTAAMAILNASLPAFFDRRLGDVHAYGYGMGAIGAGLLCGEALSACVRRDSVARRSVALAFLFCGGAIFVLAGTTAQSTAYLFLFLLGASDGTTEVVYDTLFQARFPRSMLAGAFAAAAAVQRCGMIVGFLLAPVLLAFGWMTALEVSGAVCLVGGCLAGVALVRPAEHVDATYLEPEPAPTGI